ncbi:MAG: hypothetical protein QOD42_1904 [Sphingomonadales bacterium]|jgi:hypothetical protein|nr:hypothetical protein [Sphingomonadales bacterium]
MTQAEQKDDRPGKGTKPSGASAAAAAPAPQKSPGAEIEEACEAFHRALQAAWEEAIRQSSLAELQVNTALQQIVLKTQNRQVTAHQEWAGSVHGVDPSSQAATETLTGAAESYHGSVNNAVKDGHEEWEGACREQSEAVARAGEAYRAAVEAAVGAYLGRLKALWSAIDPAELCPGGLWRLAQATGWAANVAASVARP